ncbi:MAG: hypothetical protein GC134_02175 [Proteobacteria bacterium]|nr:hypothetical protein [Pseudomonadota bacterium]
MDAHRAHSRPHPLTGGNSGAVLIAVVGITAVIAALLVLLLDSQRLAVRRINSLFTTTDMRYMALSGMVSSINILSRDKNNADGIGDIWYAYREKQTYPLMNGSIEMALDDATARPNINMVVGLSTNPTEYQHALRRYLNSKRMPENLVDSAVDWLDTDDISNGAGAENSYYQSLMPPYRTPGALMQSPSEMLLLRGAPVEPDAQQALLDALTVIPTHSSVNINTVDENFLRALAPEGQIAQVIRQRRKSPYTSAGAASVELGMPLPKTVEFSAFSPFFEHTSRVMLEGRQMGLSVLIDRQDGSPQPRRMVWH